MREDCFGEAPVDHLVDAVAALEEVTVVGDPDYGDVGVGVAVGEELNDFVAAAAVQGGRGFIDYEHAGVVDEGAGISTR